MEVFRFRDRVQNRRLSLLPFGPAGASGTLGLLGVQTARAAATKTATRGSGQPPSYAVGFSEGQETASKQYDGIPHLIGRHATLQW